VTQIRTSLITDIQTFRVPCTFLLLLPTLKLTSHFLATSFITHIEMGNLSSTTLLVTDTGASSSATNPTLVQFSILPIFEFTLLLISHKHIHSHWLFTMAESFKATGCGSSLAGIACSNPARVMDVCLLLNVVCCQIDRCLCSGPITHPEKSYRLCCVKVGVIRKTLT
jgi:hypothetical protein